MGLGNVGNTVLYHAGQRAYNTLASPVRSEVRTRTAAFSEMSDSVWISRERPFLPGLQNALRRLWFQYYRVSRCG